MHSYARARRTSNTEEFQCSTIGDEIMDRGDLERSRNSDKDDEMVASMSKLCSSPTVSCENTLCMKTKSSTCISVASASVGEATGAVCDSVREYRLVADGSLRDLQNETIAPGNERMRG